MTQNQIIAVNWLVIPLLGGIAVQLAGIPPLKFLIAACLIAVIVFSQKIVAALFAEETAEESEEIDKEVDRMEGRTIRFSSTFEINLPEQFRSRHIDESRVEIIHEPTGRKETVDIRLKDAGATLARVNATLKALQEPTETSEQ